MPRLRSTTVDIRLTNLETTTEATTAQLQALTAAVQQLSGEVTRVNANLQTLTAEIQQNRRNPAPPAPNPNRAQDKKAGGLYVEGVHINLKVKTMNGKETYFRMKRSTKLKNLMVAYCDRECITGCGARFIYRERRLPSEETPDDLGMKDGDEVFMYLSQKGS